MDEKDKLEDDFEYNDSLNDLLKEKDRHEFSWLKTVSFVAGVVVLILVAVILTVNLGEQSLHDQTERDADAVVEFETVNAVPTKEVAQAPPQPVAPAPPAPKPIAKPITGDWHKVIAGTFNQYDNAKNFVIRLQKKNVSAFVYKDKKRYRVQVGAFRQRKDAQSLSDALNKKGVSTFILASTKK